MLRRHGANHTVGAGNLVYDLDLLLRVGAEVHEDHRHDATALSHPRLDRAILPASPRLLRWHRDLVQRAVTTSSEFCRRAFLASDNAGAAHRMGVSTLRHEPFGYPHLTTTLAL